MSYAVVRQAGLQELNALLQWRIEVLRHVFALPENYDTTALYNANRAYYEAQIPLGGHIACFARLGGGRVIGCGGICFHEEMPSPDNPTGHCAYLMNIYVRAEHRGRGVGKSMVRWLIGQALSKSVNKIYLETSLDGKILYKSLGFSEMRDMMLLTFKE